MKIMHLSRSDGGVSVMTAQDGADLDILIQKWHDAHPAGAIDDPLSGVRIISMSPAVAYEADRTFRNAWVLNKGKIEHDLPKAKTIAHVERRAARAKELAPLDIEATIPTKAAGAETKRQAIRDKNASVQVQIDSASDVQTLKTIVAALRAQLK